MGEPLDPLLQYLGTQGVQPTQPSPPRADEAQRTADGRSFQDILGDFVRQVDGAQKEFDQAIEAVERGEVDNLHQVMIAQNQAQLSLRLAAEVRNKLVEAYKEVMRTQL